MLQQIENAYLMILRIVVILIAGALLAGVVFFGLNSFKALQAEPQSQKMTPSVTAAQVIEAITPGVTPATDTEYPIQQGSRADSNRVYYEKSAAIIEKFLKKETQFEVTINKEGIINVIKERAVKQERPELVTLFAKNLSEVIEKALSAPAAAQVAARESPSEAAGRVIDRFESEFNRQLDAHKRGEEEKVLEHEQKRAEGMQSLYMAGAAFGAFLLIVFLSIFIRIERNLRHLEARHPLAKP